MSSIIFRYGIYQNISIPIIPIKLRNNNTWHEVWVYADSGATYSILKSQEAERLGIDIYSGKKQMITVGDGSLIPIYLHRLRVNLNDYEFEANIGFSDRLGIGFNILGRKDFFEEFVFCFDDYKKVMTVTKIKKS